MFCKPISVGVTVYMLVFPETGYLHQWSFFTGKGSSGGKGQPTDQEAVNEDQVGGGHICN